MRSSVRQEAIGMWCPTCRNRVDAQPEQATAPTLCPECEAVLVEQPPVQAPPTISPTKTGDALKLLERWSDQRMFSPEGDLPELKTASPLDKPAIEEEPVRPRTPEHLPAPKFQTTSGQPAVSIAKLAISTKAVAGDSKSAAPLKTIQKPAQQERSIPEEQSNFPLVAKAPATRPQLPAAPRREPTEVRSRSLRLDLPLTSSPNGPHFDVQAAIREQLMTQERSWISAIGYIFSYGGIGLLTAGAGLTLWSFYDESLGSIPKEWLVTTVGQIFLFAGIVMMVSLVIERIGNKILFRISQIDDRITRIERALAAVYESQQAPTQPADQETASKPLDVRKAG
ncbi:hypothetical protein [Polystyrenella longa]|uniref:hypothetical protein n=1 Tax=Polystyrenella longa TaxID=2528007 RepID=UPI0011A386E8|nr:hypothetical protein [Polystyrenella longa]